MQRRFAPRLGVRTLTGLCGLLTLAVMSGLAAIAVVVMLGQDQRRVDDRAVPYAAHIAAAALAAKGVANDQRGFLLSGDEAFVTEANARIVEARTEFEAAAAVAGDPAGQTAIHTAAAGFDRWVLAVQAEFTTFRSGDRDTAVGSSLGPDRALRKQYEQALADAQLLAQQRMVAATTSVAAASRWSIGIIAAVLVTVVVVGTVVILWLMRTVAGPVFRLLEIIAAEIE